MLGFLTLLALLCAGHAGDAGDLLRDLYLIKCENEYPDAQSLDVYLHDESFFCIFYCYGYQEDGTEFFREFSKEDNLRCSGNYWTKEESRCVNRTCVLKSDIDFCKTELDGKHVQAVETKGCDVTCNGEDGVSVQKPEGAGCTHEDTPWRPATCTSYGQCMVQKDFLTDPDGGMTSNDVIAQQVCQSRHEDAMIYRTRTDDVCEYLCYYSEDDEYKFDFMDFPDISPCGDGWNCMGGQCRSPDDIQACNAALGETVQEINYNECTMMCMGQKDMKPIDMEANRKCTTMVNDMYPVEGLCNESKECIVDKEKLAEYEENEKTEENEEPDEKEETEENEEKEETEEKEEPTEEKK